jgi:hypothetical protein
MVGSWRQRVCFQPQVAGELLEIDGLVVAALIELGTPHFVRALVLARAEVDERS